jgi:hypothetical protein
LGVCFANSQTEEVVVAAQSKAVFDDIRVDAVKAGMDIAAVYEAAFASSRPAFRASREACYFSRLVEKKLSKTFS